MEINEYLKSNYRFDETTGKVFNNITNEEIADKNKINFVLYFKIDNVAKKISIKNLIAILTNKSLKTIKDSLHYKINLSPTKRLSNIKMTTNKLQVKKNNKYGYRGVSFDNRLKNYTANITINNITIYLGRRNTAIEAAMLYDKAAIKLFGKKAILNFPQEENITND